MKKNSAEKKDNYVANFYQKKVCDRKTGDEITTYPKTVKEEDLKESEYMALKLNQSLQLNYRSDKSKANFLAEVIRFWVDKRSMFCGQSYCEWKKESEGEESKKIIKPEDSWAFNYKTPSTCGSCVSAQRLLSAIFGSERTFNQLCFVKYHGDRVYSFEFKYLKYFAKYGHEKTVAFMKADEQAAAKAKAEEEQKAAQARQIVIKNEILNDLGDTKISDEALDYIVNFKMTKDGGLSKKVVVDPDIAVLVSGRSEWGGSGGIAYFDSLHVYFHGQTDMQEWQWRDRYDSRKDRWDLRIEDLGKIDVQISGSKAIVNIEIINGNHGKRYTSFTFTNKQKRNDSEISIDQQKEFSILLDSQIAKEMTALNKMWEYKPEMLSQSGPSSYKQYAKPQLKQKVAQIKNGIAAYITVEQIDHRSSDPQLRYKLYVLKHGDKEAKVMYEDHAYENSEGSAVIAIVDLNSEYVLINTKDGKKKIPLG